jgi:dihydroflavonol-4-reductase
MPLKRFVFTSSYVTIGRRKGHRANEEDTLHWRRSLGPYALSRLQAEELVLRYADEYGLPSVAMCVSTTYGTGDWNMTPHGAMVAGAAFGKVPFTMKDIRLEVVGVDDAARAMLLAAEHGRNGERYIISEKMMTNPQIVRIAAEEAGAPVPSRSISLPMLYGMAATGGLKARVKGRGREEQKSRSQELLTLRSLRLMRAEAELDHSKAVRELGWKPESVEDSIRAAARFWVEMRAAMKKSKAAQAD